MKWKLKALSKQRQRILTMKVSFCLLSTPEKAENATITGHFGFVFGENSVRETESQDAMVLGKLRFRSTLKRKAGVFKSSCLTSVFETLSFRHGLVWMVDTNRSK